MGREDVHGMRETTVLERAVRNNLQDPNCMQILVATDGQMKEAELALAASIRENCTPPWNIWWMRSGEKGWTVGRKGRADWNIGREPGKPYAPFGWATDFTCFRFAIPEVMGFNGRAIYMDVDFIVLRDLREIWDSTMTHPMMAPAQRTDIALIDCWEFSGKAWWPSVSYMRQSGWSIQDYRKLLLEQSALGSAPLEWESWDGKGLEEGKTFTIHYTNMHTQPWKPYPERFKYPDHPHAVAKSLWHHYRAKADEHAALLDPGKTLRARSEAIKRAKNNMSPFMDILENLASECSVCCEFGTESGRSATALLLGCEGDVHSWDIEKNPALALFDRIAPGRFHFHLGDSKKADIPECDLLFIDGDHSYETVSVELTRSCSKVKKYIVLHDTEAAGKTAIRCTGNFKSRKTNEPGINKAITEFLDAHRAWRKLIHYKEHPGLTVLRRG